MKAAAALLLLPLLTLPARAADAQVQGTRFDFPSASDDDSPGRIGPRSDPRTARSAITTRDGRVALLLTRDDVVMQLSERGVREISSSMGEDRDEDAGGERSALEEMVQATVNSTMTTLLKRSVQYPVRELRDVQYRGDRLVFTGADGERVFEDVSVNDRDVVASFSEADARAFVREFQRLKASRR